MSLEIKPPTAGELARLPERDFLVHLEALLAEGGSGTLDGRAEELVNARVEALAENEDASSVMRDLLIGFVHQLAPSRVPLTITKAHIEEIIEGYGGRGKCLLMILPSGEDNSRWTIWLEEGASVEPGSASIHPSELLVRPEPGAKMN